MGVTYTENTVPLDSARERAAIEIGGRYIHFLEVPVTVTVRLDSAGAPPIDVTDRGQGIDGCERIERMYITHEAATGSVLRFIVSDKLRLLPNFKAGAVAAAPATRLSIVPADSAAANLGFAAMPGELGANDIEHVNLTIGNTTLHQGMLTFYGFEIMGWRVSADAGATANSMAGASIFGVKSAWWQPNMRAIRSDEWRLRGRVLHSFDDTNGDCFASFGIGHPGMTNPAGGGAFIGFRSTNGTLFATGRDGTGATIFSTDISTFGDLTEAAFTELELRWGIEVGGEIYVEFWVNGTRALRQELTAAFGWVNGSDTEEPVPAFMVERSAGVAPDNSVLIVASPIDLFRFTGA